MDKIMTPAGGEEICYLCDSTYVGIIQYPLDTPPLRWYERYKMAKEELVEGRRREGPERCSPPPGFQSPTRLASLSDLSFPLDVPSISISNQARCVMSSTYARVSSSLSPETPKGSDSSSKSKEGGRTLPIVDPGHW